MIRTRRRFGAVVAGLLAAGLLTAVPTGAGAAPQADVTDVVIGKLLDRVAASGNLSLSAVDRDDTRVSITRRDGQRWVFGTAVVVAPQHPGAFPDGWVFVARAEKGRWQVAFDGEPAFAGLASAAPVVSAKEKTVFNTPTPTYANGDYRTGMRLPYAVGQTWTLSGGPHGWGGHHTPYSSLDLAGGDQRVLAARGGTAYTMCKGWIRVIHDRGYATDYYHLWNNINVNGTAVGEGAYLGDTGTDVTCGGSALGRHVHFALRQNSAYVPIANHGIGKWVLVNGSSAYGGSALHGSTRAYVGNGLYNYGALGFTQGIVDTNGGGTVNKRSGPGTGYAVVGSVGDGATVSISCSSNGTSHAGRWGTTSLWNRLTDGTWVSDAFLWTGLSGPVNGWC